MAEPLDVLDAFGTIEDLNRTHAPEAVMQRLADYLSRYGYTAFLITGLPVQRERLEPHILLNGWPAGWYERYTEAHHYRNDPCVKRCFQTIEPFAWDELPPPLVAEAKPWQVMHEATEFGLRQGLCVPLHDVYGFQSVVTMAGPQIEMPPQARRLVHMVSLYAYGAAERAIRGPSPQDASERLTEREREVMRWTAVGKTFWEIGEILGITEDTVNDHMRHVRQKLGTRNAAHSVAEAYRRREIRL
jgi:LuxR family quorum sensing-dependent transcriptional regulator